MLERVPPRFDCLQDKPGFDVEVAVIPPFPYLALVSNQLGGTFAKLGAQVRIYRHQWGRTGSALGVGERVTAWSDGTLSAVTVWVSDKRHPAAVIVPQQGGD